MDYHHKYIKYKKKYLQLKGTVFQSGGFIDRLPKDLQIMLTKHLSAQDIKNLRVALQSKQPGSTQGSPAALLIPLLQTHEFNYNDAIHLLGAEEFKPYVQYITKIKDATSMNRLNEFPNLTSLTFDSNFTNENKPLEKNILPSGLKSLTFGKSFKNGVQSLKPSVFPVGLKSLEFGSDFTNGGHPLQPGVFPSGLESLTFGAFFTNGYKPFGPNIIPPSVTELNAPSVAELSS